MKIPYLSGLKVSGEVELKSLNEQEEPNKVLTLNPDNIVEYADYIPFYGEDSLTGHTHSFASLTSKPTTLSGYGITDAQATLLGTGLVKSASGTISYITDNSSNWNTAYSWGNHATQGYITSAAVGNGTLTLNVTGSGLSGSASFTANQSGGSTFTVTSNATASPNSNTIAYRDSNGYLFANYFNAPANKSTPSTSGLLALAGHNASDNYYYDFTAGAVKSWLIAADNNWAINVTGTAGSETLATVTARGATSTSSVSINGTLTSSSLVVNNTNSYLYLNGSNESGIIFQTSSTAKWEQFTNTGGNSMSWYSYASATTRMILDSSGNLTATNFIGNWNGYTYSAGGVASTMLLRDGSGRVATSDLVWFNSNKYIQEGGSSGWYFANGGGAYGYLQNSAFITASTSAGASTIVQRDSSGYIFGVYANFTSGDGGATPVRLVGKNSGSSFYYDYTPANIQAFLGLGASAYVAETLATVTARGATTTGSININSGDIGGVSNIYSVGGWFRNTSQTGLYNTTYTGHFYQTNTQYWSINPGGSSSYAGLRFQNTHEGTTRGYIYYDSTGFGLLNNVAGWSLRVFDGGSYGGQLYGSWNTTGGFSSGGNIVSGSYVFAGTYLQATTHLYLNQNYGSSVVGFYDSYKYQGIWAMGDAYKLPLDGSTTGTLYGLAWSHSNAAGQTISSLGHQLLVMSNGTTRTAIGDGIWTGYNITAAGNMYSQGYQVVYNSGTWGISISGNADTVTINYSNDSNSSYQMLWGSGNGVYGTGGIYCNPYTDTIYATNYSGNWNGYAASNYLGKNGSSYYQADNWIQLLGNYGLYSTINGAHLYPNNLSTYTQWALQGNKNGYGGFYDYYSGVNGMMYDSAGNGGVYREASGKWYFYYSVSNDCVGIGSPTTTSGYAAQVNGALRITSDISCGGTITATGGFFDSDIRFKDVIETVYNVYDLQPIAYRWKEGSGKDDKEHYGYSAQDVEKIMPDSVAIDGNGFRSVNYIEVLVAKVKMLEDRVKQLEGFG